MNEHESYHAQPKAHGYVVPISDELLAEANEQQAAFARWLRMGPERRAQLAEEQRQQRAAEREATERKPLTLDGLLEKLGFSPEYAEHLMQSYCNCGDGHDGWDYCAHARDEGLTPW